MEAARVGERTGGMTSPAGGEGRNARSAVAEKPHYLRTLRSPDPRSLGGVEAGRLKCRRRG